RLDGPGRRAHARIGSESSHSVSSAPGPSSSGRAFFFFVYLVSMLRIALPNKGRLSEDARELFADAGLEVRARGERALTAALGDAFEAIFVRAQDIPEFVADGAADVG